jgi:hypothetical protein
MALFLRQVPMEEEDEPPPPIPGIVYGYLSQVEA